VSFHGRLEDCWKDGLSVGSGGKGRSGYELFEVSGFGVNAGVGAGYGVGRVHYGMADDETRCWTQCDMHRTMTGLPAPRTLPGYAERWDGDGSLIHVGHVTGRLRSVYACQGGIGGILVPRFGNGAEDPFEVRLRDVFRGPARDDPGRLYGLARGRGGRIDGLQRPTDFADHAASIRFVEESSDGTYWATGRPLMLLEATSDSWNETKTNAGVHLLLENVRHPLVLNYTRDSGRNNKSPDVSQFHTVTGTMHDGYIATTDHDRLGTPQRPLTVAYVRVVSRPRHCYRPRYHAIGCVIQNCTFIDATPEGKTHEGPRIRLESGSGYGEERWAPPPASVTGRDVRIGRRGGHWAVLSDSLDFRSSGFMADRPIVITGTRRNDGTYTARLHVTAVGKDYVELKESLQAEAPSGPVTLTQPNVVDGALHMTGMRFVLRGRPLVIRSTHPERLTFDLSGIGEDNQPHEETGLTMDGQAVTSARLWKRVDKIAIASGSVSGALRAGLDAPIRLSDVVFAGTAPQVVMRIDNERYPEIPVRVEMENVTAPTGSRIEAFDATHVHVTLDGRPIRLPYVFGGPAGGQGP
jgi:hypothetical protein